MAPTPLSKFDLRRTWCITPLLMLAVVFALGDLARQAAGFFWIGNLRFEWSALCGASDEVIQLRDPARSLEALASDMNGRIRWSAAALAVMAVGLITLVTSGVIVARHLRDKVDHPLLIAGIAALVLGVVSAIAVGSQSDVAANLLVGAALLALLTGIFGYACNQRWGYAALVIVVLAAAAYVVTQLPLSDWYHRELPQKSYQTLALTMPVFDRLQLLLFSKVGWLWFDRAVGAICMLVVATLAIAVCALVADCRREPDGVATRLAGGQSAEAALRDHANAVQLLQYLGGGVLVGGVVYLKLLHDWPIPLICDSGAATMLTGLASHWPVVVATYWTLMLVAIFVPVQISLARAARDLARRKLAWPREPVSEQQVDEWLDARGLRASPAKQIANVVTVLSPWLTSVPVAALFDYARQALAG
jgi:hypothetical protein